MGSGRSDRGWQQVAGAFWMGSARRLEVLDLNKDTVRYVGGVRSSLHWVSSRMSTYPFFAELVRKRVRMRLDLARAAPAARARRDSAVVGRAGSSPDIALRCVARYHASSHVGDGPTTARAVGCVPHNRSDAVNVALDGTAIVWTVLWRRRLLPGPHWPLGWSCCNAVREVRVAQGGPARLSGKSRAIKQR